MIEINDCNSLNDISKRLFGKINYTNREKVKKYLMDNGIDWKEWIELKKNDKHSFCLNCGKLLKRGQKKFCSHSCSSIFNNRLICRNPNGYNGKTKNIEKKKLKINIVYIVEKNYL